MKKRLVIIGGGFVGSNLARSLENQFEITFIDSKDYFEFTPGILRTIVDPEHISKIQVRHSKNIKNSKILVGLVEEVGNNYIIFNREKIIFDYLVICTGSRYSTPIKQENVVLANRAKVLVDYYEKLCESKSIGIIGGGLVGVELAAEIYSKYPEKDLFLVQSNSLILPRNSEKSRKYVMDLFNRKNVKVYCSERVKNFKKNYVLTNTGKKLSFDLLFNCTGIKPNSGLLIKNFSKNLSDNEFVKVDKYLRLEGSKNIFVGGDLIDVSEEKTAQNAVQHSKIIKKNLLALMDGKKLKEYVTFKRPIIISLGKWDGVFESKKIVFTGVVPGILKWIVEKKEMLF